MSRIVVIGAGIAGLASAALLGRDGHEVVVCEARDEIGGRAGRWKAAGFAFDTGPSWYLMPEVFDDFFARLGTSTAEQLDLVDLDPGYRVLPGFGAAQSPGSAELSDGEEADRLETASAAIDIRADRAELRALAERLEPGAGDRLEEYLDSASEVYDLALDRFLYTDFGREHRGAAALPRRLAALAAVLGRGATDIGGRLPDLPGLLTGSFEDFVHSRFAHPVLRQILLYPAIFLATDPERAPALYHLMSRLDLVDGVRYPMGGMSTIIDAIERLARDHGVEIRTGAEVVALPAAVSDSRRIGEVVVRTPDGLEVLEADAVVAACDLHHLETRLLESAHRSVPERTWRRRDPGMGALTIMLGVRGRIPGITHHTLLFTEDWEANFASVFGGRTADLPEPASAYVCAPSATDPSVAPEGHENLFILVPAPANPSMRAGHTAVEEYADRIVDAVGARLGAPDLRERTVVRRVTAPGDFADDFHAWSGTALGPAHTLAQSALFRDSVRSPRATNLLRTGAFAAPGVGLPMCLISAVNACAAFEAVPGISAVSGTDTVSGSDAAPGASEGLGADAAPGASA